MADQAYFAGAGDGACARATGLEAAAQNAPLHERQLFRIDCESDPRVRKLTGFRDGAQMRKVFLDLGLDKLLPRMPRDCRTYKRQRFEDAFDLLKGKRYVPQESFDRCRSHFNDGG